MICPQCQTPNPDGIASCSHCSSVFPAADPTRKFVPDDAPEMPTMASPTSLEEWVKSRPTGSIPVASVLTEGLEIAERYRVRKLLGMGGMGAVYLVHDDELDRDVALKLIRSDIGENPEALERFKREIQLSSKVTHRNVLRVYDLGASGGIKYLTMQFVEGEDLSTVLKRVGRLATPRLTRIFRQILEGLRAAHEQGVIHRDLKPQNIMLDASDNVYVTDFGLAKSLEQSGMTQTGAIVGTPYYMSPEQVKGSPIDHRSDIYSLGVILYEMSTGRLPFTGSSPYEVMAQRLQRLPEPAGRINPDLPSYLSKILDRCLMVDTAARYQTIEEILRDLDAGGFRTTMRFEVAKRPWLRPAAGRPPRRRRPRGRGHRLPRPTGRADGAAAEPAGRRDPARLAGDPALPQRLGRLLPRLARTQPGRDASDRRGTLGVAADRSVGQASSDPGGPADLRRLDVRPAHAPKAREVQ